jgi:thymidylate synthase (FAD)
MSFSAFRDFIRARISPASPLRGGENLKHAIRTKAGSSMTASVKLLQYTENPERVVALAARLCYSPVGLNELEKFLTEDKIAGLIKKLYDMGHLSAFEHASFTFGIEGVSRALTHQLVRHRLASYSQQSQRYVAASNLHIDAITPGKIAAHKTLAKKFKDLLHSIDKLYEEMVAAGIPAEDARYILPNASETKIIVTMNARELLHFFALRCCNRAQWEIHAVADKMLKLAKGAAPEIFGGAGPGCAQGPCPEGKMTCGKIAEVRKKYRGV